MNGSSVDVVRFATGCVATSALAAIVFLAAGHFPVARGPALAVGVMSAFIGGGVSLWFALRSRDLRLWRLALVSSVPLAFWCWSLYRVTQP